MVYTKARSPNPTEFEVPKGLQGFRLGGLGSLSETLKSGPHTFRLPNRARLWSGVVWYQCFELKWVASGERRSTKVGAAEQGSSSSRGHDAPGLCSEALPNIGGFAFCN